MKMKIQFAILILVALISLSCGKNKDKVSQKLTTESLSQTRWKGTYEDGYGPDFKNKSVGRVGIFFTSPTTGDYSLLWIGEGSLKKGKATEEKTFEYCVSDKIVTIRGGGYISGVWLVVHYDGDTIVLEYGTGGEGSLQARLILERTR